METGEIIMYKFLGNFDFDFEIKYDNFKEWRNHNASKNKVIDKYSQKQIDLNMSTEVIKAFREDFPDYIEEYLGKFNMDIVNSNFHIQRPGNFIPPHVDNYLYLKENKDTKGEPNRIMVFMNDWSFGQVFMVGDSIIANWKKGDAYIMDDSILHMTSNGSYEDKLTLIITGYKK